MAGSGNGCTMSLVWHRFLCRFLLWAAALLHLAQAVWLALGGAYQGADIQSAVYTALPALRCIDYGWAACMLGSAVLLIPGAVNLSRLRPSGLTYVLCGWLTAAAANLLRMLLRFAVSGLPPLNVSEIAQTLLQATLAGICAVYYRRRPGLFALSEEVPSHEI